MSEPLDIAALLGKKRQRVRDRGLADASNDMIASGGDESVSVCIRVRPFNRRELELHRANNPDEFIRSVVEMPDGVLGKLRLMNRSEDGEYSELETFNFTRTFWSISEDQQPHKYLPITQDDVFDVVGRSVLTNALSGYNACVFAYGQTGSGKTHSMMGDFRTEGGEFLGDPGLIPRMCRELFTYTDRKKAAVMKENPNITLQFDIKLSAIEIYNEQVKALFWKGSPFPNRKKDTILKIRLNPKEGAFVEALTELNPKSWEECVGLIANGVAERTVAATLMNDESSRSHSVFVVSIVEIETLNTPPEVPYEPPVVTKKTSRINLVDLAGSERLKKSGAQGQQRKEAAGINQSLTTLKKVIDALVNNSVEKKSKHILVPYRESALTQLLSHSLGGNSKTTMIACVSPHHDNQEETLLTLRYANRTKGIVNKVKSNEDNAAKQAMLLKEQMAALQAKLDEGPQVYDEKQMAQLRDQLRQGQEALNEQRLKQQAKEDERKRLEALYQSHKDARYVAMFYNSFKRVLITRMHAAQESKIGRLEAELRTCATEKDHLANQRLSKEKSIREQEFMLEELRRKEKLWDVRSDRHEAMSRQLVKDISLTKGKVDKQLSIRFGLRWIKNRNESAALKTMQEHKEGMQKEHDQYLQSIVREAKKQFELLVATYAEKREARQERVEQLERNRLAAKAQIDKTRQLKMSLESTYLRSRDDHERRENEKEAGWAKQYDSVKEMYEEKLAHLEKLKEARRSEYQQRMTDIKQASSERRAEAIRDLEQQIKDADDIGRRRLEEAHVEMSTQIESLCKRALDDSSSSLQVLENQFTSDENLLITEIRAHRYNLEKLRESLRHHYDYAVALEATAQRGESALANKQIKGSTDYVVFAREVEKFVKKHRETVGPHDFAQFNGVLRQSFPDVI